MLPPGEGGPGTVTASQMETTPCYLLLEMDGCVKEPTTIQFYVKVRFLNSLPFSSVIYYGTFFYF